MTRTEAKRVDKKEVQGINYRIIYSGRRTIAINIGPETGVTVRAPYGTSSATIEKLIASKSSWIKKHLETYRSSVSINNKKDFDDGSIILFQGKEHRLRFLETERYFLRLSGEDIEIGLRNLTEKKLAGPMLEKWYRVEAEGKFRKKFGEILLKLKEYNFRPTQFAVRTLRRRWGSCSSKGKITISSELVKLDEVYLEYVIVHELCHLRHPNHGKEFYKLLSEVFPDWKQKRSELKRYVR